LTIEWIDREKGVDKSGDDITITKTRHASPAMAASSSRARPTSIMPASGQIFRVEATKVKRARSAAARSSTYAAMVVRGDFAGANPAAIRQSADRRPFYNGTHYLTLQMLEGFIRAT